MVLRAPAEPAPFALNTSLGELRSPGRQPREPPSAAGVAGGRPSPGGVASSAGPDGPCGVCIVDKVAGLTSHDVVARARRLLGTRKVGHAGTLDPDATGVLVLGVGRATRLLRYVTALPKSYEGEVVLGVETTTLDASGDVLATYDMAGTTVGVARAAAADLVGDIDQVPPMVSAVRVGGRRLHELARQGMDVERPFRPVTVHRFEVVAAVPYVPDAKEQQGPVLRVEVECSSGTYVRTLAADLGRALGGGAHLRNLRRTAVGPFTLSRARPLDDLHLLPPSEAVAHLVEVAVDDEVAALVANGTRLARCGEAVEFPGEGPWALTSAASGKLLAVYEAREARACPAVVLVQPADVDHG